MTHNQQKSVNAQALDIVCAAIDRGADPNTPIECLLTPRYRQAFSSFLLNNNALVLAVHQTPFPEQPCIVKRLLEQGVSPLVNPSIINPRLKHSLPGEMIQVLLGVMLQTPHNGQCARHITHVLDVLNIFEANGVPWPRRFSSSSFHHRCWQAMSQELFYKLIGGRTISWKGTAPWWTWLIDHEVNLKPWVKKMRSEADPSNVPMIDALSDHISAVDTHRLLSKKVKQTKTIQRVPKKM